MNNTAISFSICAVVSGTLISTLSAIFPASAATITSVDFRGGGCQNPGCTNASIDFDEQRNLYRITKNFNRVEHEEGEEDEGGGGQGGGQGGEEGGEEGGEDELFERLPGINLFLSLANNGGSTTYFFEETVTNSTGTPWDGFLHRLRGEGAEAGIAQFLANPAPGNTVFPTLDQGAKKLLWYGAQLLDGNSVVFNYAIQFDDFVSTEEDKNSYRAILQQFPQVTPEAVPTPALLPGLIGLGFGAWRKRKKAVNS